MFGVSFAFQLVDVMFWFRGAPAWRWVLTPALLHIYIHPEPFLWTKCLSNDPVMSRNCLYSLAYLFLVELLI